jgi:hypothetical protein
MKPTSEADAAAVAALEGKPAPTLGNAEGVQAGGDPAPDSMSKGGDKPAEMGKPADQDKADGGKQEPVKKGDDKEEDEDKKEGEEEEKGYTEDELNKSVSRAIAIAEGSALDNADRRAALADKLAKGELTDEEREELLKSLQPDAVVHDEKPAEELERSYATMAVEDPDIKAAADSGDDGFNIELAKSMQGIGHFVIAQQGIIKEQGELIKSLTDRLEKVEQAPVGRQSANTVGQAQQLQRGFMGNQEGGGLTKNDLLKGLVKLNLESPDGKTPEGNDIVWATATVDSNQPIPPELEAEIKKALGK